MSDLSWLCRWFGGAALGIVAAHEIAAMVALPEYATALLSLPFAVASIAVLMEL